MSTCRINMKKLRKRLAKTPGRRPSESDLQLLAASVDADDSTRIELSTLRAALDGREGPVVLVPDSAVRYLQETAHTKGFPNVENYCIYKIFKED